MESSSNTLKTKKLRNVKSSVITVQFKLLPTAEQEILLKNSSKEYIRCVNEIANIISEASEPPKLSSADVAAQLPSAVKNEAINAAKSAVKKFKRGTCGSLPILKKPVLSWNNQNYKLGDGSVSFPLLITGKSTRISVDAVLKEYQLKRLQSGLGSLRVTQKNGKWIAQVAVKLSPVKPTCDSKMGVDLGLKIPAVAI